VFGSSVPSGSTSGTKTPSPLNKSCALFSSDPSVFSFADNVCVGDVRAASYGHTLGGAVGLAHITAHQDNIVVNKAYLTSGVWEVEVAGTRYPAQLSLEPMYDPKNLKIKA